MDSISVYKMLPNSIVHRHSSSNQKLPKSSPLPTSSEHITINELEVRLYRSVHTFLLLCEVFVCLPYGAHRPTRKCSDNFVLLLHVTWSIVIYAGLVATIHSEYSQSDIDLPTVQKPLYFCEYLVYLVHVFQILLATFWARHKCCHILRTIAEFDFELVSFGRQPDYQQVTRFIRAHLCCILLYAVSTAIVDYFYSDEILLNYIRSLAVYLLPNVILCVSLVQYYALQYAINQRAIRMHEVLHAEVSQKTSPKVLRERLQSIRLLYSALQVFTKEVNNSFAFSLVLVYIGSFTNLSVNVFLLYKYADDNTNSTISWIMYSVIWSTMHIAKMFLILYYNYLVQGQKNSTTLILNEIEGQNPEMEETVTHFILQLMINTRSNVVCGVAELNMNFITSLLIAMSTVFIFLLQYDITYEALTKTHN